MDRKIVSLFIVTILLLTSFFLVSTTAIAQSEKNRFPGVGSYETERASLQKSMSYFTENKGQFSENVSFVTSTDFGKAVFYDSMIVYLLIAYHDGQVIGTESITLTFPGSNLIQPQGFGVQSHKNNYFIGDSSHWVTGARNYQSVQFKGLWDGVDLVYKCVDGGMKYEFVLAPDVPVDQIRVRVEGASLTTEVNSLILTTSIGSLTDSELVSLQSDSKLPLTSSFVACENEFGFNVPDRDVSQILIIDPVIYSTYLGGSGQWGDWGGQVGVDSDGNAYIVGATTSPDFPVDDPYQGAFGGGPADAYILKLSADGSELIYSTFIGGSDYEGAGTIFVGLDGSVIVAGSTNSTDFPLVNPYQGIYGGGEYDVFVLKLNPAGDALLYSTYIGGNGWEGGRRIAVDTSGNVYMTGATDSANFPLVNAFQSTITNRDDLFVLKLNASGDSLLYSTYLGGNDSDFVSSIAVDSSGEAFVTGVTLSPDFPTANAYQSTYAGDGDIFITKFSPDGTSLVYSTYIGTSKDETGHDIAVDASGSAYVTGYTGSSNFPLVNPFKNTYGGGWQDGFVLKLNPAGSALIYSSYIGGSGNWDEGDSIAVDTKGSAYVAGWTNSPNFPLVNATQSTCGGGVDIYVLKIHPSGNPLLFSTYYGGSDEEDSPRIALDMKGNFYVSGTTYSLDFPTYNAYQDHNNDWRNAFLFKFRIPSPPSIVTNVTAISGDGQVDLTWGAPSEDGGVPITGYRVYRGTSPGTETRLILLGNVTTYVDSPLTNGQAYYYKVSAINTAGEGPLSDEVLTTPAGVPSAPLDFEAVAGDAAVNLSWAAPAYAGAGTLVYHLFRNDSQIWTGTGLAYSDLAVSNGITYSYKVSANNSMGWGANSTTVLATPMLPGSTPTAPLDLSASPGNELVELAWSAPSYLGLGTITYHLFRGGALIWSGTSLEHIDAPLVKGVEYSYTVAAQNAVGWGPNSTAVLVTAFGVPDAPWGLVGVAGDEISTLTWNTINYTGPGTLVYHLLRDGTEVWNGTTTSHQDSGLVNGQSYEYKVAASNSIGTSEYSPSTLVAPQGLPTQPRGLMADPGDSYINLNWTMPSYPGPGEVIYHLYRNGTLFWSGSSLAYNDTSVVNGISYIYKVTAQNSLGWGVNSSSVSATPVQTPVPPGVPTGLQATASDGEITLTWQAPSQIGTSPITAYKVYRGTSSGAETYLDSVGYVLTFTDTGLTNGQAYFYKVKAVSSVGDGDLSQEATATPVSSDNGGSDDMILIAAGVAVVALAAIGGAMIYMRRRK
jgi:fibronectin type 3 domain-containing protein